MSMDSLYVVSPSGKISEVEDEAQVEYWLKQGFTTATPEQIAGHRREKEATIENLKDDQSNLQGEPDEGVYLATVTLGGSDGYGMASKHLYEQLRNLGVQISTFQKAQKLGLLFHSPQSLVKLENAYRIIYTMFESDKIPDAWIDYLQEADLVLVPSHWCMEVFGKAGINAQVLPLGYDDDAFGFMERENKREARKDFVFLHYNAFNVRKEFLELFAAFQKAFDPMEPVKLVLKTTVDNPMQRFPYIDPVRNPNIEVIQGSFNATEMKQLLGNSDCFVFPSRGEGFGLTPLEAMATGIPAIIPNAHGISEYFNPEFMYEAKVARQEPAIYTRYKGQDVGNMVVCDVDQLAAQMRYVYEHQEEALEKGRKAAEYVKQFTYKKTAGRLKTIIDEYLEKPQVDKPLRNMLPLEKI